MKEIIVKINKLDGSVEIEAAGFSGKACDEATKVFEKAVGKVEDKQRKPEYYKKEKVYVRV